MCGSDRLHREWTNYIKRVVALPGENIAIRNGDIYINGKIARKPAETQEAMWQLVHDSAHIPKWPLPDRESVWARETGRCVCSAETSNMMLIPGLTG